MKFSIQHSAFSIRPASPAGFSLAEMLTALSILLFIMLGVAVVFSNVSQALRQALSNSYVIRGKMNIVNTLKSDLENMSPDGFLVLANMRALAFQDQLDRDTNGNAAFNGKVVGPAQCYHEALGQNVNNIGIGKRWYRCDLVSFCSSGYFPDLMGMDSGGSGAQVYQNPGLVAGDAWITWGNAAVDTETAIINMNNNDVTLGTWQPNNLANDWSLARRVVLLPGTAAGYDLRVGQSPLPMPPTFFFQYPGSIRGSILAGNNGFDPNSLGYACTDVAAGGVGDFLTGQPALQYLFRPRAMIKASGLPITRQDSARTSVVLVNNVSDFAVEFAGDYLNQNMARSTDPGVGNKNPPPYWTTGQDGEVDYMYADLCSGPALRGLTSNWPNPYTGQLPPQNMNNVGSGPNMPCAIYAKCTIWYGLHATQVAVQGANMLVVPPTQAGLQRDVQIKCPPTYPTGSYFPTSIMTTPAVTGGYADSSHPQAGSLYGPFGPDPPGPTSVPTQWYMAAAFDRTNPQLWPRMLRVTYRVHSGGTGDDPGVLVQNIYHLPAGR